MPPSEQERRCIDFACHYLGERYGGSWSIQEYLDDLNPSAPSPEVTVGNGQKTAAVEVKWLMGDSTYREYVASLRSNEKYLIPSCGGYYYLVPAVDFRLPMQAKLRRLVKREVERVARTLGMGQKGAIRIPREGRISLISESGPSFISCLHRDPYPGFTTCLRERVTGRFMLVDEGLEHSFVTREGEAAFTEAVVAACVRRLEGKTGPFTWYEEWELSRLDDQGGGDSHDGVWILATAGALSMPESVEECVHDVLGKAMQKFRKRRWADLQVIVLETSGLAPASLAAQAVETFEPGDKKLIDHFLLVDGKGITEASTVVLALSREAKAAEKRGYQHVLDSPISEDRVRRFKEDYLKGRSDIGATEKIFRHCGAFQQREERNNSARFGFNVLVDKGPFVDGSNWGELRAWKFAVEEERRLLKDLRTHLEESVSQTGQLLSDDVTRQPSTILSASENMSDLLGDHGFHPGLIVVAVRLDIDSLVSLQKVIAIPGWELPDDLRTNWLLGKHAGCPILHLNDEGLNGLYVVDLARFAKLFQYSPEVELKVKRIDEATAKRMLETKPDLGLDMNALRSRVHLTLHQSYQIEIHDRHAVWAAKFSP